MAALRLANEVRGRRKELKADLRAGQVLLADVLFSEAPYLQTMRVREILLAVPRLGKKKADRALATCQITHTAPLRRISPKTRELLLEALVYRCPSIDFGWKSETRAGVAV